MPEVAFIPNYSAKQLFLDVLIGLKYPFTKDYWEQYWYYLLPCSIYLISAWCLLCFGLKLNKKRRVWVFPLLSSIIAGPLSIIVSFGMWTQWFLNGSEAFRNAIFSNWHLSQFIVSLFLCSVFWDLCFAIFFYRKEMDILMGWTHHVLYLLLVFPVLYWKETNLLAATFPEEIPTIIFSVGSVFPAFRNDLSFGLSFFSSRIGYHLFAIISVICIARTVTFLWIPGTIVLIVHISWFTKWFYTYVYLPNRELQADTALEEAEPKMVEELSERLIDIENEPELTSKPTQILEK